MFVRVLFCVILPSIIMSQNVTSDFQKSSSPFNDFNCGIKWTDVSSWKEVLKKAKEEKKMIFVDCYTTWCAPCMAMDAKVYPSEKVGAAMNEKFISVKLQMDKTDKDNEYVKSWYNDANLLDEKYKIAAYPTLLFFSSDGTLLHRVSQGLNVEGFLDVVSTALDPEKRYYSRLAVYQSGKKDTAIMRDLVKAAQAANDKKLANQIAEDYIGYLKVSDLYDKGTREFVRQFGQSAKAVEVANLYIDQLKDTALFTKDNIEFIRQFTKESKQKGFKIFYDYPQTINQIMEDIPQPKGAVRKIIQGDYAQSAVRWIIYLEEIYQPIFKPAVEDSSKKNEPNWVKLSSAIQKKYPKTDVERILIDAKVMWYRWIPNWSEYSKWLIKQMNINYRNKNLEGMTFSINNNCWDLFKRTNDKEVLNQAIKWMEAVFKQNEKDLQWGTALDTYANLLYKVGRTKEALEWEEKAVKYEPTREDIISAWEKMKKGLPTWPQD